MSSSALKSEASSSRSSSSQDRSRTSSPYQPSQELLDEYQLLLSSTIDTVSLTQAGLLPTQPPPGQDDDDETGPGGRPMTKAEKQNAKKKRRKEREREAKQPITPVTLQPPSVEFRLFSSCPVRPVKLDDVVDDYLVPSNPRHRGLTEEEKASRRRQAEVSSVKYSSLGGPSVLADRWSRTTHTPRRLITSAKTSIDSDHSGLIILEIDQQASRPTDPDSGSMMGLKRSIPLVEAHASTRQVKKTRRSRKPRKVGRVEAKYWRPSGGLGGKSKMTTWGYGVGMQTRKKAQRDYV